MDKKNCANNIQLFADTAYSQGIFQRVLKGKNGYRGSVVELYQKELSIDLTTNPHFIKIQEIMLHRHLYAHNSGIIDDKYIQTLKELTGLDIATLPQNSQYPAEDMYYFDPLGKISNFIQDTRNFFAALL